jgi:hypothetical protein
MHAILQTTFSTLIILQFLVVTLHDWLNIPGWTHGRQVQAAIGRRKFVLATLANSIFPGLAVAFIFLYKGGHNPSFVLNYWVLYCAVTALSAVMMWYVPYFLGTDTKTKRLYADMYAGTKQVLPPRGDNPRPNLLHLYFHALFLVTLCLAVALRVS